MSLTESGGLRQLEYLSSFIFNVERNRGCRWFTCFHMVIISPQQYWWKFVPCDHSGNIHCKENRKITSCNQLDLETLGSQPIMPKKSSPNIGAIVTNVGVESWFLIPFGYV
jgi:hypothetical protein